MLNDEQKQLIKNNYKAISDLTRLTQMVSGDEKLDGRSKIGRAIRKFMVEEGLNYETSGHQKVEEIILTDEEKDILDSPLILSLKIIGISLMIKFNFVAINFNCI